MPGGPHADSASRAIGLSTFTVACHLRLQIPAQLDGDVLAAMIEKIVRQEVLDQHD